MAMPSRRKRTDQHDIESGAMLIAYWGTWRLEGASCCVNRDKYFDVRSHCTVNSAGHVAAGGGGGDMLPEILFSREAFVALPVAERRWHSPPPKAHVGPTASKVQERHLVGEVVAAQSPQHVVHISTVVTLMPFEAPIPLWGRRSRGRRYVRDIVRDGVRDTSRTLGPSRAWCICGGTPPTPLPTHAHSSSRRVCVGVRVNGVCTAWTWWGGDGTTFSLVDGEGPRGRAGGKRNLWVPLARALLVVLNRC